MVYYLVRKVGLEFRLSLVWMGQFRKFLKLRCWRCFPSKVGLYVGQVDGHLSCVVRKSTLYTRSDKCEQTTYGPRHSSSRFGLGTPASWWGLYTSTSCPGWNTGHDLSLLLFSACWSARSFRFWCASSKAICKLSRVVSANSSVSAILPT